MGNKFIKFVLVYRYFFRNKLHQGIPPACINSTHIFESCAYDLHHMILLHVTGIHLV